MFLKNIDRKIALGSRSPSLLLAFKGYPGDASCWLHNGRSFPGPQKPWGFWKLSVETWAKTGSTFTTSWNYPYWLVVYLPLWKMMEFVSWDDDIPNKWKNKKCSKHFQTTNQHIYPWCSQLAPPLPLCSSQLLLYSPRHGLARSSLPSCAIFKWYPLVIVHSKSKYVWFRGEIKAERFHRICRIYSHMFKPAKRFSTTHHHDNCNLTRIIRKSQYRIQLIQQDDSPSFLGWYGWSKNGYTPKLPKSMTILPVKLEFWGCST